MKKSERIAELVAENIELKRKLVKYEVEEKLKVLLEECQALARIADLQMHATNIVNAAIERRESLTSTWLAAFNRAKKGLE